MTLFLDHGDVSPTELDGTTDVAALEDAMLEQSPSNSVHSNQETEPHSELQQKVSSLELENKLLKNEVASLNQEMATVLQRSKDAQNGKWINLGFSNMHFCLLPHMHRFEVPFQIYLSSILQTIGNLYKFVLYCITYFSNIIMIINKKNQLYLIFFSTRYFSIEFDLN